MTPQPFNLRLEREPSSELSTLGRLYEQLAAPAGIQQSRGQEFVISSDGQAYEWLCEILEDPVREVSGQPVETWKLPGKTAIPFGRYRVVLSRSERFSAKATAKAGRLVDVYLPEVLDVRGFLGIRFHAGTDADDTEGCLLTGSIRKGRDEIGHCDEALGLVVGKIAVALYRGREVWLDVVRAKGETP